MFRTTLARATMTCVALLALAKATIAADYPSSPIKIIVPNPAGGSGDISARLIAQKLQIVFRQPVVVENISGASGTIGMNMLKRAAPDGHTLGVVIALAQTIDRIQNKQSSFDLAKDFSPITAIANNPAGLLVNSKLPPKTMAEFLAYAKSKPGELSYATAGIGTAHHLYGEVLNKTAGISLLNVPYRGVGPAFNDVLGGHVPVGIISLSTALSHLGGGQVRLLTVFRDKRYPKAKEVPTIKEVLPDYRPGQAWVGILAPPNLPEAIAKRLHDEIVKILNTPEVQQIMTDNGLEIIGNTPQEFGTMIRENSKFWNDAAVAAGLIAQ